MTRAQIVARGLVVSLTLVIAACGSAPTTPDDAPTVVSDESAAANSGGAKSSALPETSARAPGAGATAPGQPVPKRAAADFDRAVGMMRAGDSTNAELEFKQLAVAYPQFASPRINLALLQRKAGRLDEAEVTLKSAVESTSGQPLNALAWNELGITQRMRGQFTDAVASYEHAIAADEMFAPAHRNLAVVLDLYLSDPERALTELERYKELTGEEKPVNGWIAELRQRTGKKAPPKPASPDAAAPPAGAAPEGAPADGATPAQGASPPGASEGATQGATQGATKDAAKRASQGAAESPQPAPPANGAPQPAPPPAPKSGAK